MAEVQAGNWAGDGEFTAQLLQGLTTVDEVVLLRVEDAPVGRNEPSYSFISNEIYVQFRKTTRVEPCRRLIIFSGRREISESAMTLAGLERTLAGMEGIGTPDYSDDGMLQYLRAQRIVPPYQTRGYKLVELVRIYEVGTPPR
jgi:hypothetical protein